MPLNTDEMLLFRNTMQITEGHLTEFTAAVREAVEFVEHHGPQLMVQTFVDEQRLLAYSYQLYRDSAAVVEHWRLSDPYIRAVMEHCTVLSFQVHGTPSDEVLNGLRELLNDGTATLTPRVAGFVRPFAH
jgi:hypothetical protein